MKKKINKLVDFENSDYFTKMPKNFKLVRGVESQDGGTWTNYKTVALPTIK